MRFFLILIFLTFFVLASNSQKSALSYRAIRIAPYYEDQYYAPIMVADSVIFHFESYYADASSSDRERFEEFVRLIPMVNRKKEIQTIIDIYGKDFYKNSLEEFLLLEDQFIHTWFKKMPEDHSFWMPKFKKPEMRKIPELLDVRSNLWGNPRSSFAFSFQANTIEFSERKSRELYDVTNRTLELFKTFYNQKSFFPEDSLFNSFQTIQKVDDRYEMMIITLQNMLAYEYWGDFEMSVENISNQIINDKQLRNSSKVDYLLCVNRLMAGYRPHFFMDELLTNYAWIRTILENPNSYPDEKLTKEIRYEKLMKLDRIEIQTFFTLAEYFPEHELFIQEGWKILINYCENNNDQLIDYILLSEFKTKSLEYTNGIGLNEIFNPKLVLVQNISEKWSLIQAMNKMLELFKNDPESLEYHYLVDRFYRCAMIHFRMNDDYNHVRFVVQNAFSNFTTNNSFLADYVHIIPEIYRRCGDIHQYEWWKEKLGYLKKHYPDSSRFLPVEGVTKNMLNFNALSKNEKEYFITRDFSNEISKLLRLEQFDLGFHFKNQPSELYSVVNYCQAQGAYESAFKVSQLIGRIDSWDGAGEYVAQLFRKRNKIIDWEKIRNKSTENRLLNDYQEELKKLNSDLYERNRILLISFIASAILVIISVYLYVQTRKIKNELVRKNKKLEALRLSIGQIGHLAKNAVSEIYNSYFQSPTIYELDEGKKALKRLRNVFQSFEDNGSRITQTLDEEIEFAVNLVLIQNRAFSEGKSKQDILDRIITHKEKFRWGVTNFPIYTIANIIDNVFKHSNLNHGIQITISSSTLISREKADLKLIKIVCEGIPLKENENVTGKGTVYINDMLKNHSDSSYAEYKRVIGKNGFVEHILMFPNHKK